MCIYTLNHDCNTNENENDSNRSFKTVFNDSCDNDFDISKTVGDFNVAPKHDMDTAGYIHVNNPNSRHFLNKMIPLCNLERDNSHVPTVYIYEKADKIFYII